MKWFKHISDSGHDPDIGLLESQFNFKGYYLFFRTLEIMSREFDIENPGKNEFDFRWFLNEFSRKIDKKTLLKFLEITNKKKRIFYKIEGKSIFLNCPKLKELCDEYTEKMLRRKSGQSRDEVGTKSGQSPESRARADKEEEEEKDKEKDKKKESKKKEKAIQLNKKYFIDEWNKLAKSHNLPLIQSISGQREVHLKARISSEDFFYFPDLLKAIEEQPWLLGKNEKGWRITFDWIINASNYTKIMEKNYLHLSPRRDEIGRSQKPLTEEQKKYTTLIERKREELYKKHEDQFKELRKNKDMRGFELLEAKIKNEVARYSNEIQKGES